MERPCMVCAAKPFAYNYELKSKGKTYGVVDICEDCGLALYDIKLACPQAIKELHVQMLNAYLNYSEVPLKKDGSCEFCGDDKAHDWVLKSDGASYDSVDVCAKCSSFLRGADIQSPVPITAIHKSILAAYINYWRRQVESLNQCSFCEKTAEAVHDLKYEGARYAMAPVCHECKKLIDDHNLAYENPDRLVALAVLSSRLKKARTDGKNENVGVPNQPKSF